MTSADLNATPRKAAGDEDNEAIVLGVLDAVERDPAVTQRSVARELNIALGLANAYLKRCVRKGLIKVAAVPSRRYAYYLTPQGFSEKSRLTASYLAHSFSFFRRARLQCSEIFALAVERGQHRLLLLGAGDLAEIARLVAREFPVEIVDVVATGGDPQVLARALAGPVRADAVVVTAAQDPQATFDAAVAALGAARVHAPELLRLRRTARPDLSMAGGH